MTDKQTVMINGKHYDARTGLLIGPSAPLSSRVRHATTPVASPSVHASAQRSQTLKRNLVAKKAPVHGTSDMVRVRKNVARSRHITRFAPRPVTPPVAAPVQQAGPPDISAPKHPVATRAHQVRSAAQPQPQPAHAPSQVIKQEMTAAALAAPSPRAKKQRRSLKSKFPRVFSVASASLAVLILGAYLTYLNMPTLSIRVAAAGAGIDASYPGYHPDGYRLAGPIAYSDGEVSMQFAANAGPQNFIIKETESRWDSSAVLENYVQPKTDGEYVVYNENGLTIYTYDGNAAWVNGGIFYTIAGDAPLSNEQIRHIATSL